MRLLLAVILLAVLCPFYGAETPPGWLTDFETAKVEAQNSNRKILVLFTGSDWCQYCAMLRKETFESKEFKDYAEKNLVLLYVDFPQFTALPFQQATHNSRLAATLKAEDTIPICIFLDASGKELGRMGYQKKIPFMFQMERILNPTDAKAGEVPPGWLTDFDAAKAEAQKLNRKILVLFTGADWCGYCAMMKKETFDSSDFQALAEKNLVLLYLDFPKFSPLPEKQAEHNEKTAALLKPGDGLPFTLVLDASGKELGRLSGYWRHKPYLSRIAQILKQAARVEKDVPPPEGWLTDFDAAKAEALKSNRRILVLIDGSDWCKPCQQLKEEVLDTERFKDYAKSKFVLLYLDFPRKYTLPAKQAEHNRHVKEEILKFSRGYPGTIILNAKGGKLGEILGHDPIDLYIEKIDKITAPPPVNSKPPAPSGDAIAFHSSR